jgi:hypothetical protein
MPTFEEMRKMNLIEAALESTQDQAVMSMYIALASIQTNAKSVEIFNQRFPLVREALALFEEEGE